MKEMTTVAVCADGKVYNLGESEYPPSPPHKDGSIREKKYMVRDAFTCTIEEAILLKKKAKK